jgi:hypothetical protein
VDAANLSQLTTARAHAHQNKGTSVAQEARSNFIDVTFGKKKRDVVQARADLLLSATDWLNKPRQTQRPPVNIWARLNRDEQQAIDNALVQSVGFSQSKNQPGVDRQETALPVSSDTDDYAALTDCRRLCAEEFEKGLFLGWAGIPASDQSNMMQVCIRNRMQEKGFDY